MLLASKVFLHLKMPDLYSTKSEFKFNKFLPYFLYVDSHTCCPVLKFCSDKRITTGFSGKCVEMGSLVLLLMFTMLGMSSSFGEIF